MRALILAIFGLFSQVMSGCVHGKSIAELREDAELRANNLCMSDVEHHIYPDMDYCRFAYDYPEAHRCVEDAKDNVAAQHCVWAAYHPIEAGCETETKSRDEYWSCVRTRQEHEDRVADRDSRQKLHDDSARRHEEDRADDRRRQAWRDLGEAFQPKPTTHCETSKSYGGGYSTDCH